MPFDRESLRVHRLIRLNLNASKLYGFLNKNIHPGHRCAPETARKTEITSINFVS